MKKADIKEGHTYSTANGSAARKVIKITSDQADIKGVSYHGDAPPWVLYEQVRGPDRGRKRVLSLDSFASWAKRIDEGAPAKPTEQLAAITQACAPLMGFLDALEHHPPAGGVNDKLVTINQGAEHEAAIHLSDLWSLRLALRGAVNVA